MIISQVTHYRTGEEDELIYDVDHDDVVAVLQEFSIMNPEWSVSAYNFQGDSWNLKPACLSIQN